jgi:ABC-type arginine transport system permease subunit
MAAIAFSIVVFGIPALWLVLFAYYLAKELLKKRAT